MVAQSFNFFPVLNNFAKVKQVPYGGVEYRWGTVNKFHDYY